MAIKIVAGAQWPVANKCKELAHARNSFLAIGHRPLLSIRRHEQRIILVYRRLIDAIVVVGVDVIAIHTTQRRELICNVAITIKNVLPFLLVISAVAFVHDA